MYYIGRYSTYKCSHVRGVLASELVLNLLASDILLILLIISRIQ